MNRVKEVEVLMDTVVKDSDVFKYLDKLIKTFVETDKKESDIDLLSLSITKYMRDEYNECNCEANYDDKEIRFIEIATGDGLKPYVHNVLKTNGYKSW